MAEVIADVSHWFPFCSLEVDFRVVGSIWTFQSVLESRSFHIWTCRCSWQPVIGGWVQRCDLNTRPPTSWLLNISHAHTFMAIFSLNQTESNGFMILWTHNLISHWQPVILSHFSHFTTNYAVTYNTGSGHLDVFYKLEAPLILFSNQSWYFSLVIHFQSDLRVAERESEIFLNFPHFFMVSLFGHLEQQQHWRRNWYSFIN